MFYYRRQLSRLKGELSRVYYHHYTSGGTTPPQEMSRKDGVCKFRPDQAKIGFRKVVKSYRLSSKFFLRPLFAKYFIVLSVSILTILALFYKNTFIVQFLINYDGVFRR